MREDQIRRYARHVLLPDVGGRGQQRLLEAKVAVDLTAGPAAVAAVAYLAAAGVGRIALLGDGPISADDAATGILYGARDVGRSRIDAIRERVALLNPDVSIVEDPSDAIQLAATGSVAGALWEGGRAAAVAIAGIARR
jgi:molybdopterin/thiamine biosynthesis adenylyltransferase